MVTARLLTLADIDVLADVHARAFYDDPLQVWAFPDDGIRLDVLRRLFALQMEHGSLPLGASWCDPDLRAGALWAPPGRWRPTPGAAAAMASMPDIVGDALPRLSAAFGAITARHPDQPEHWYLQGVGTDPQFQGQGYASAVLRPVLDRCDAEGTPAYLESTKERNVAIYEHLGWRVVGEVVVPGGGPRIWAMWRDPA